MLVDGVQQLDGHLEVPGHNLQHVGKIKVIGYRSLSNTNHYSKK